MGSMNPGTPTATLRGGERDPQLVTLPGGFKHSNVTLEYAVPNGDRNRNLTLVWTIRRPFSRAQAGQARILDKFEGYVQVPAGAG